MRIQLTSVEETKNLEEIQKKIKSVFPNYTVTVIGNKYATKEGRAEVRAYCKNYYETNKEEILRKKKERLARQKADKEMKIIDEHYELKKAYKKDLRDR